MTTLYFKTAIIKNTAWEPQRYLSRLVPSYKWYYSIKFVSKKSIGFANKNNIEHKTIKASAKELVKENKYHVQHVNRTGSELKKMVGAI